MFIQTVFKLLWTKTTDLQLQSSFATNIQRIIYDKLSFWPCRNMFTEFINITIARQNRQLCHDYTRFPFGVRFRSNSGDELYILGTYLNSCRVNNNETVGWNDKHSKFKIFRRHFGYGLWRSKRRSIKIFISCKFIGFYTLHSQELIDILTSYSSVSLQFTIIC